MAIEPLADHVTVAEAARLLAVSESTIWRWIDRGDLPAYRVGRRRVRLRRDDLRRVVRPIVPRWTEEQLRKAREAFEALERIRAEDRAQGRIWPNAAEDIRAMREERAEQIDPLH